MISSIGTDEFIRIRLGVGPDKVWGELRDYVLRPMGRAERETADQMSADAAEASRIDFDRRRKQGDVAVQSPRAAFGDEDWE